MAGRPLPSSRKPLNSSRLAVAVLPEPLRVAVPVGTPKGEKRTAPGGVGPLAGPVIVALRVNGVLGVRPALVTLFPEPLSVAVRTTVATAPIRKLPSTTSVGLLVGAGDRVSSFRSLSKIAVVVN